MTPEDEFERKEFRRALVLGCFFKFSNQVHNFLEVSFMNQVRPRDTFQLKSHMGAATFSFIELLLRVKSFSMLK